jgi:thiamine biosynthesis lipoprotein
MDRYEEQSGVTRRGILSQFTAFALTLIGAGAQGQQVKTPLKAVKWDDKMELAVDFEIVQPDEFRYHRPYVAVWLEDKDGKSIRTLSLWVQNSRRGPRWIPDLRRWYRGEQDAMAAGGADLVATVSSATRMPGKYSVTWDGKDDKGKPVMQGSYTFNLEMAREHGPYQVMQKAIIIGPKPFKAEVVGNTEIKGATVEYRKRK